MDRNRRILALSVGRTTAAAWTEDGVYCTCAEPLGRRGDLDQHRAALSSFLRDMLRDPRPELVVVADDGPAAHDSPRAHRLYQDTVAAACAAAGTELVRTTSEAARLAVFGPGVGELHAAVLAVRRGDLCAIATHAEELNDLMRTPWMKAKTLRFSIPNAMMTNVAEGAREDLSQQGRR